MGRFLQEEGFDCGGGELEGSPFGPVGLGHNGGDVNAVVKEVGDALCSKRGSSKKNDFQGSIFKILLFAFGLDELGDALQTEDAAFGVFAKIDPVLDLSVGL